MTRTVGANLKTELGAESQTIATCFRLTLTSMQPTISNVTVAGSPSIVTITTTYPHNRSAGDVIQVVDVAGITGLNYHHSTNDQFYPLLTASGSTMTIADPGIGGSYTSGGEARVTYGITNVDQNLLIDGVTYYANAGGVPSALRTSVSMEVGSMDNIGVYAAANISEVDIQVGRVDYAECEVFVCDYSSLSDGKMIMEFGFMGPLELKRNHYVAKYESLASILAQDTIRILSPDCPYDLGDTNCGLDVAGSPSFTFTGSVTSSSSKTVFIDTAITQVANYFDGGLLTWTTGANAGLQMEVQTYTVDATSSPVVPPTFTLFQPMPFDISVSPQDQYQVVAGCDKSFATCKSTFNNVVNFGGFNYLPGMIQISSVGGKN